MTLAKGLTGAHLPLGAVVLSAEVAARLRTRDALHRPDLLRPSAVLRRRPGGAACLRGRRPDRALAHARRTLFAELQALQARHAVIGDVRGGHGLFAVVELVADRATREPLAPWPQTPPALQRAGRRGDGRRACPSPAAAT